ncbi:AraC family transcriptional regulator [Paenibacillus solanacearum]|uniref:AraC family transcriptional regulator n=1 Tax=Paenibacillus solanacearum TaxID=2048548 RepID=UPI001C407EBE|nr:AraC family transcriptional regulator [Paenibacillus solanacearum]
MKTLLSSGIRSKWFYRYLLSYIAILAVPLLVIGLFVYYDFILTLQKEVTGSNLNMLSQVKEIVDVKIDELDKIAYQISENPELTPYMATKNAYQGMNTIRELKNYAAGNSFIYEVVLHMRDHPMLYSSFSSYPVDRFAGDIYRFRDWSQEEFERDLDRSKGSLLRPAEEAGMVKEGRIVPYIVPIPYKDEVPYGNVIFLLTEQSVRKLILNILRDYGGNTFIADAQGRIVTSLEDDSRFDIPGFLSSVGPAAVRGSTSVELGGDDYFVTYIRSSHTGWTYITLVEKARVMAPVVRIKQNALAGLAFTLLLGAAVIWLLMNLNYNPLLRLKNFAETLAGRKATGRDELEAIRLAVSDMSENSQVLRQQLKHNKPALKAYVLDKLLKGHMRDIEEFNRSGSGCGVGFAGTFYRVAVFLLDGLGSGEGKSVKENVIAYMERHLPEGVEGYGIDGMENNRFLFLIATRNADDDTVLEALARIRESVWAKWQFHSTVGLGGVYSEAAHIGKSCIEATTALEYRLVKGKNRIILFGDIGESVPGGYSKKELADLELSLKQGDADKIKECLDAVIGLIHLNGPSLFMARSICYELIHTILRPLDEMNMRGNRKPLPDVLSLFAFETVEELSELVCKISLDIGRRIKESKESRNYALKEELIGYIERHYGDYHFSLHTMAEALSMSASYLSRYFKDQTGLTVSQYVHELRLDKAKELLRTGDDNIQELVKRIGYASPSSFIRKFREAEGMTPGEYRRLYVKDGTSGSG